MVRLKSQGKKNSAHKMKKHNKLILGSFLMLSMLVTATGCNNDKNPTSSPSDTPSSVPDSSVVPESSNIGSAYPCISVAKAIEVANAAGEDETAEDYYLYGVVKAVSNPQYGEMTIQDDTGEIYVFGIEGYSTLESKPLAGDEIVIKGKLKMYKGKAEFGRSELIAFHHEDVEVNDKDYTKMSIKDARSKEVGEKVKLTGVVAQITYGQKHIPNGFYLIDETESIYIYDPDAVQTVKTGNTVTLIGERANFINPSEASFAEQFGYQGAIQVASATVIENDKGNSEFNRAWVKETTMKEMLETPMDTNITGSVFKVKAYVHRRDGHGFINYYFNDLDDKTGSYVYTSNSGADFDWLDPYDGKLCDVYISPINCKSTSGGCVYRLIPLALEESSYKMGAQEVAPYVITYHAMDQFLNEYNSNPHIKLLTSVSDENLGFKDVALSYASSNTDVIEIVTNDEGTFLNTKNDGTAEITITAKYQTYTETKKVTIVVKNIDVSDAVNVKAAIDAQDGEIVKVRGVVASSLVNKDGFYIADETGVIAVTTTKEDLGKIHQGDMVCFEGTRNHKKKEETTFAIGQSVIEDSKLILNEYGEHDYSTATFDTTKKIEDINNLSVMEDHSTEVYVVKAKIDLVETNFYTRLDVVSTTDPEAKLMLYSSGANQYKWLFQFKDQEEVTLEVMLCNWNDKKSYKACVLSAQAGDLKVINTLNFPL